jgi:hypothetical protein
VGKRSLIRFREKGGKEKEIPVRPPTLTGLVDHQVTNLQ